MTQDYRIAMLWVEGSLSYVEQLCIRSFLDVGHHVTLYHYGPVTNVPDGTELQHGSVILDKDKFLQHHRTGSFALFSDVFRYHLLTKCDRTIWADTDAYCVKPFTTPTGHFYGWESPHHINGGVLGLPPDSEALGNLLQMTKDEFAIPVWYPDPLQSEYKIRQDAGDPVHVSEMPWGVWGPHAVTHHLHQTGEDKYAFPREVLYPVPFKKRRHMVFAKRRTSADSFITKKTLSIHLYGRRIRSVLSGRPGGMPDPGGLVDQLLKKHKINPSLAPIPVKAPPKPVPAKLQDEPMTSPLDAASNLTDLADRYGSDKGSKKHRYTELYHMLFHPYQDRDISFLEMGLLIGGPEHGISADRKTDDLPSIRMWLDYFSKATIHGLDVSDFSWFKHPRFTFHRCDMDDRAQIAAAIDGMNEMPTIVIDDASHASHHQQNAFLEIFPRLPSGALYVIEDLRWQPKPYEQPGITKTAALFRSWLDNRVFQHTDPNIAAEFNALALMISGCIVEPVRYQKKRKDQVAVIHKR